jgi:hypothetical protein
MNELAKNERDEYGHLSPDRIKGLTDDQLRDEFQRSLGLSARALVNSARLWSELRARGHEVSVRGMFGTYLPLIASGEVLPEVLVTFAGATNTLLDAVTSLPVEQQKAIMSDGGLRVPIVEKTAGGELTERMVKVEPTWSATTVKQVFADRRIKTPDEQRAELLRPLPVRQAKGPVRYGKIKIDRANDTVTVGKSDPALVGDMIDALVTAGYIPPLEKKRSAA